VAGRVTPSAFYACGAIEIANPALLSVPDFCLEVYASSLVEEYKIQGAWESVKRQIIHSSELDGTYHRQIANKLRDLSRALLIRFSQIFWILRS